MLPQYQHDNHLFTIPTFHINRTHVQEFVSELATFHQAFATCFVRPEPRTQFYHYMVGQFSHLERKSIEPIAVNVLGKELVRAMQRMVSDAVWDEPKLLGTYHAMVGDELGESDGVVMFDESGFVKKGTASAGVARQYCGTIGKVENCQVGVFMGYASRKGYALADTRLYLPKTWCGGSHAAKRRQCGLPANVTFQTKPQQAAAMLLNCYRNKTLPFKYIVADTVYGNNQDFIDAADQCIGTTYFVSMPATTACWLQSPRIITKKVRAHGTVRTKRVVKTPHPPTVTFEQFAENLHEHFWCPRTVSEGAKGPITYEVARRRVTLMKDDLPWKTVWLIVKRTIDEEPTYYFSISNASSCARLRLFVWLSGVRWAIEQCFEETKHELGMAQYEVRKYAGWWHHILTCMLAHFFLWHLKLRFVEEAPCLTLPQIRLLLKTVLPLKVFPVDEMLAHKS